MNRYISRTALSLAVGALVAACGGGESPLDAAQRAALSAGESPNAKARAVAVKPTHRVTVNISGGTGTLLATHGSPVCESASSCYIDVPIGVKVGLRLAPDDGFTAGSWGGGVYLRKPTPDNPNNTEYYGLCGNNGVTCDTIISDDVISRHQSGSFSVTATLLGKGAVAECSVTRATSTSPSIATQSPRLLLNNQDYMSCLKKTAQLNSPEFTRLKAMVDSQMATGRPYTRYRMGALDDRGVVSRDGLVCGSYIRDANPDPDSGKGADVYGYTPWYSALLYKVTNDSKYADFAIKGISWLLDEEEYLSTASYSCLRETEDPITKEKKLVSSSGLLRPGIANDSYLELDDYLVDIAYVLDWLGDYAGGTNSDPDSVLDAVKKQRLIAYGNQALWNVWKSPQGDGGYQATWGGRVFPYSGWGQPRHDPTHVGNNYYFHHMNALMHFGVATLGQNPMAEEWVNLFRQELEGRLLPFDNGPSGEGGGSLEGTGYGASARDKFKFLDTWERSTGQRVAGRYALASLAHQIHNFLPTLDRMHNVGDQSRAAEAPLYDYHRDYLQVLVQLFPDEKISGAASNLIRHSSVPRMQHGFNQPLDYLYYKPNNTALRSPDELSATYWGEATGQFMMRSGWNFEATASNFICSPHVQSHQHDDSGSFTIFKGDWLAHDANGRSNDGLRQAPQFHNMVRFNRSNGDDMWYRSFGHPCRVMAFTDTASFVHISADVTPVYANAPSAYKSDPTEPGYGGAEVKKVQREYVYLKPNAFVVMDRVETYNGATAHWVLNTPVPWQVNGDRMDLDHGGHQLTRFDLNPSGARATVISSQASRTLGTNHRLEQEMRGGAGHFLNVFGIDGAVTSATAVNENGKVGANIQFEDGSQATVFFPLGEMGGELHLTAPNGTVLHTGPLPKHIAPPPLYAGDPPPPVRPAPAPYPTPRPPGTTPPPPPPGGGGGGGTPPPPAVNAQVTLNTSVPDGAIVAAPGAVNLTADVTATGSTVARVEFYRNDEKIAEDTTAPYEASLSNLPAGGYKLTARVVLNNGSVWPNTPEAQSALVRGLTVETLAKPPAGKLMTLVKGSNGYTAVTDFGLSSQNIQYNGGKGIVDNGQINGAYRIDGAYEIKTVMRFGGLGGLKGRRVLKAELQLAFNDGDSGYTLRGEYLNKHWDPLSSSFGWTKATTSTTWSVPGIGPEDVLPGLSFSISGFVPKTIDVRKVLLDPTVVQRWIDTPTSNYGMVISATQHRGISWIWSSEAPSASVRPKLNLTFE